LRADYIVVDAITETALRPLCGSPSVVAGYRGMPTPKITKAERLVNEQMLAMLEWASEHPTKWHNIGKLEATQKAAQLLAKRGVIEVWPETNLYRLKPKS
jgi:hypothetical protein